MNSLVFAATALPAAALALAYYRLPRLVAPPLLGLNRRLAGLRASTLALDGHAVHYLEGGRGEPVLLLHGIFAEKDHWVDFARPLTGRYRVLVPDLPGYGQSSRLPEQSYDYAAQTQRLKGLLDALGLARVHLAGSSMGGTLAALLAMRHPERVASLAFVGAPHGLRSPAPSLMDQLIDAGKSPLVVHDAAGFERMMALLFARRPFLPYPIRQAAQAEAILRAPSNMRLWQEQLKDRHLLHERIDGLRARTLALWGGGDLLFHVSGTQVLRARLPHAEVHVLPGVGHLPMMETPRAAARLYARFLAGQPASPNDL